MLEGKDLVGKKVRLLGTKSYGDTWEMFTKYGFGKSASKEQIVTICHQDFISPPQNKAHYFRFKEFKDTGAFLREDFELVEDNSYNSYFCCETNKIFTRKDFLNTKIYVNTPEENKKFQELMFSLGIKWGYGDKEKVFSPCSPLYLFIDKDGVFSYINDTLYFNNHKNKEIFYNNIFHQNYKRTFEENYGTPSKDYVGTFEGMKIFKSNLLKTSEEIKMEKPKNKMEEQALKQAKEEIIKQTVDMKAEEYKMSMEEYIRRENLAVASRKDADELAKVLGITVEDKKKLF